MKTRAQARANQFSYCELIANKFGLAIVTCPNCGYVLIAESDEEESTCPHCGTTDDFAMFPDLFHEGMEWQEVKND